MTELGVDEQLFPPGPSSSHPDKPAVIVAGSGESLTYAELNARSNRLARLWQDAGLGPGGHVAALIGNETAFFEVAWAALRSGLVFTPINYRQASAEIAFLIDDCEARSLVVSSALRSTAAELFTDFPLKVDIPLAYGDGPGPFESVEDATSAFPPTPPPVEAHGTSLMYSSGSTGRPKGVRPMRDADSETQLLPDACVELLGFQETMRFLSPAPLYHAAPYYFCTSVHRVGGTAVIMERFDAPAALQVLREYQISHSEWVPTMFVRMLKLDEKVRNEFDAPHHRAAYHTAAPCPPEVKRAMIDWWGPILVELYGGTEDNGMTLIDSADWLEHPGSVGRAIGGTIDIVDDHGDNRPAGEVGTVYFGGGLRFEYWKDPELTARAYLDDGRSTLGDMGYLDPDGYLYLTDRRSALIIRGGVNIYPREIEDVLIGHPAVLDAAAVGVADEEYGEAIRAVIQPNPDHPSPPQGLESSVLSYARERLGHFKCPTEVMIVESLPRSAAGKILRKQLKARYGQ